MRNMEPTPAPTVPSTLHEFARRHPYHLREWAPRDIINPQVPTLGIEQALIPEQLGSPAEVDAVDPDAYTEGMHYVWAWLDEEAGRVRTRMFAPGLGIRTDEATGSAAIRLTAALGRDLQIEQGAGSRLVTHRRNLGREVEIGGRTTPGRDVELA